MIVKKARRRPNARGLASNVRDMTDYITHGELLGREIGDMADYATQGEKVLHAEGLNFLCDDYPSQRAEMVALAGASRSDNPVTHYILSWKEGERPTVEQAREAVNIFLEEMGLKDHQAFWAIHQNTENLHLHLAVNRVHPETKRVRHIDYEKIAACRAVARIEHEQGWEPEKNALFVYRDGELIRRDFDRDTPRLHPRASDAEAHTGEASAQRRAQERALPILQSARSWQELHERLAKIGMAYERHGGGAIVKVGDRAVKASAIHRQASLKAMEKRLGAYEPAKDVEIQKVEDKEPVPAIQADPALYRVWQAFEQEKAISYGQPLSFKSFLRDHGYGDLAREWGHREHATTPQIRPQTHKTKATHTLGLTGTEEGPSRADPNEMAFTIGRGLDPHSIEALKAEGLEPARVIITSDKALVVVLKSDRILGPRECKALTHAVRQAVPEAEPCPVPDRGLVLEARGVVCTRARGITREAERGPEL